MQEVSFIMAFVAGTVSFLSSCVLPLVPSYLSFVSVMFFDELAIQSFLTRIRRIRSIFGESRLKAVWSI